MSQGDPEPSIDDLFVEILRALEAREVEYLLVGGMAVNVHGLIRATEDIDFFVKPHPENIEQLKAALMDVWNDPCIAEIDADELMGDYPVVRYGPPVGSFVIDIITRLGEAFEFDDLEGVTLDLEGTKVRVATPRTLYLMKRDTVRPRDRADALALREKFEIEDD